MAEVIIFDWKRTLYDPEKRQLITGALEVLCFFKSQNMKMFLVGKDAVGDMPDEIKRLEVQEYFEDINLVGDTKTDDDIGRFIDASHAETAVVVGDRVRSEIAVGNRLGALTVWVETGKFANELPLSPDQIPNFIIGDIVELIPLSTKF